MAMRPSYDLWSAGATPTFDFSDRLNDQAAVRLQDIVEVTAPVRLDAEALDEPTSWSRAEGRTVGLAELMATHYPATARRFGLEPPRGDTTALRVTQLSDQEFVQVTLARLDYGIHDFLDLPGVVFASYPLQLLRNELELESTEGVQIVGMVAQRLALLETRLASGRVLPE
jgi:hypothetical protein